MNALPKNIILKELENVSDQYLGDILNYIQFLRSAQNSDDQKSVINHSSTVATAQAYATVNLNKPDYIIVTNHLN